VFARVAGDRLNEPNGDSEAHHGEPKPVLNS
jgi:hypothetical protein